MSFTEYSALSLTWSSASSMGIEHGYRNPDIEGSVVLAEEGNTEHVLNDAWEDCSLAGV